MQQEAKYCRWQMMSCLVKIQILGMTCVVVHSSAIVFLWFLYGIKKNQGESLSIVQFL